MMDLEQVERLVVLMREMGVSEISLELPEYKISIKRGAQEPAPTSAEAALPARLEAAQVQPKREVPITSPAVGIFHQVPTSPGQWLQRGEVVGQVEAMRVNNPVLAPANGRLLRMEVEEGGPVEYGQVLMVMEAQEEGDEEG